MFTVMPGEPDLVTHDLRHFTASALIAGDASVKLVQTVLGHSSAVVTLSTYAHMWPGDDEITRAVIDANLSGLRTPRGLTDQETGVVAGQDG
jgi:integrase